MQEHLGNISMGNLKSKSRKNFGKSLTWSRTLQNLRQ